MLFLFIALSLFILYFMIDLFIELRFLVIFFNNNLNAL